ncbi:hypothetical protein EVAR_44413_1 [Eumeta japonica]|uniref:Uncharacterized protein n=1 Tax=Eumeta variegata TaxID=151549 RepID=A0A4C1XU86_EUMVA|nr:hypothetical protein EVAR_44413_1 [Eumeta japonica]
MIKILLYYKTHEWTIGKYCITRGAIGVARNTTCVPVHHETTVGSYVPLSDDKTFTTYFTIQLNTSDQMSRRLPPSSPARAGTP